jgi:ABC-2 type transport system ATP-binding protein
LDYIKMKPAETTNPKSAPARRAESVVWLRGVSRYFDNPGFVRALSDVSFEVRRGEVFGLLGPSGSGKSTTIRILAGRLLPSEGKARVFGRPPKRRSARMRVGYLPERRSHDKPRLFASVIGFLRGLLAWRKRPSRSEPADLIPANERHRLLRQVLAKNPDLLLLDEPFSGLDAAGISEMKGLIVEWASRGKTVILASASLGYTRDVCKRFAVYYAGKVEAIGTLDEILETTDAIRLTGPVLPQETAERLLAALRKALSRPGSATESVTSKPQGESPIAAPAVENDQASVLRTIADEVLAPLVGTSRKAISSEFRKHAASAVNHEKLAALSKPAASAGPKEPGKKA